MPALPVIVLVIWQNSITYYTGLIQKLNDWILVSEVLQLLWIGTLNLEVPRFKGYALFIIAKGKQHILYCWEMNQELWGNFGQKL